MNTTTPHDHVSELLPWLLNGTLDADERREVEEHLAGCDACRTELEATRSAYELHTFHLPPEALTAYAEDPGAERYRLGEGPAVESSLVEAHLEHCASCREELAMAREGLEALEALDGESVQDPGAEPLPFRRPAEPAPRVRWALPLAASLLIAFLSAVGWFVTDQRLDTSQGRMAELEMELRAARQAAASARADDGAAARAEKRIMQLEEQLRGLQGELSAAGDQLDQAQQRVATLGEVPPEPAAHSDPWVYRTSLPEVVRSGDDTAQMADVPEQADLLVFQVYGSGERLQQGMEYHVVDGEGEVVVSGSLTPRSDDDPLSGPYVGVALRRSSLPDGDLTLEVLRAGEVQVTIPFDNG